MSNYIIYIYLIWGLTIHKWGLTIQLSKWRFNQHKFCTNNDLKTSRWLRFPFGVFQGFRTQEAFPPQPFWEPQLSTFLGHLGLGRTFFPTQHGCFSGKFDGLRFSEWASCGVFWKNNGYPSCQVTIATQIMWGFPKRSMVGMRSSCCWPCLWCFSCPCSWAAKFPTSRFVWSWWFRSSLYILILSRDEDEDDDDEEEDDDEDDDDDPHWLMPCVFFPLGTSLAAPRMVDLWSAIVVAGNCYLPRLCFALGRQMWLRGLSKNLSIRAVSSSVGLFSWSMQRYAKLIQISCILCHFPIIFPSFPHHFPIIFPWFSHISTGLSQLITIFRQALGLLSPPCGSTWWTASLWLWKGCWDANASGNRTSVDAFFVRVENRGPHVPWWS